MQRELSSGNLERRSHMGDSDWMEGNKEVDLKDTGFTGVAWKIMAQDRVE
jgi:hypothetical protein